MQVGVVTHGRTMGDEAEVSSAGHGSSAGAQLKAEAPPVQQDNLSSLLALVPADIVAPQARKSRLPLDPVC